MPTRDAFMREATSMFAQTVSLDEIVDRAHEMLFASIKMHLASLAHDNA
jgi:stearoyl-CoA desaturase (delta-9 desaturase)